MKKFVMCISNDNINITPIDTINYVKEAGYNNVFIQWYNENWNVSQEEQLKYIKESGLNIEFAHLGYKNINLIWEDNDSGESLVAYYKKDLNSMKENNILLVVMHLTTRIPDSIYNKIGLDRLQRIVDYAQELGIKVAFENTRTSKGYLEYVLDNIKNENVGVCYDIGHDHAHLNDELDLSLFKDRIYAIHLHDNDGSADQHLIPFDGTINWNKNLRKIKDNGYEGPVTLELIYSPNYKNMNPLLFYKKGYEISNKIIDML